jgi:hypothetical protein
MHRDGACSRHLLSWRNPMHDESASQRHQQKSSNISLFHNFEYKERKIEEREGEGRREGRR